MAKAPPKCGLRRTTERIRILRQLRENADGGDPYMGDVSLDAMQILASWELCRPTHFAELHLKRRWTITDHGRAVLAQWQKTCQEGAA